MTTLTADTPVHTRAASPYRLGFLRVLRSEFLKLLTLRSTWWSLAIALVLAVGIAFLVALAYSSMQGVEDIPAVLSVLTPVQFTMLVAGILGALTVTGEYSTGMIRSSLAAEPRRGVVLVTKAISVAVVIAVTQVIASGLGLLVGAGILDPGVDWAQPAESSIPLLWGVVSMSVFALIGTGFGFLIRNTGGAIAATVVVLFVLPIVVGMFTLGGEPWQWVVDLGDYLPGIAGQELMTPASLRADESLAPSIVSLLAWPAVLLTGGWLVLRTRDA